LKSLPLSQNQTMLTEYLRMIFFKTINKIRSISLKWKLLIPFLFFAFTGTSTLTYIGLNSQIILIKNEEKKRLVQYYQEFLEGIAYKETQALSIASVIAENPEVLKFLAERKREALYNLLINTFTILKTHFNIEQLHFHIPPGISFLRLHFPSRFGDDLSASRKMITDVMKSSTPTSGIQKGKTGFGIRGVVPLIQDGIVVGTVEIGHSFGESFLKEIHKQLGPDLALYEITDQGSLTFMAGSSKHGNGSIQGIIPIEDIVKKSPCILIAPEQYPDRSILFGHVQDYSDNPVAIVEISMDRSEIQSRLSRTRNLMIMVGLIGIAISFLLTYLVTFLFVTPIKGIVRVAQDIALGKRESRITPGSSDEIGTLAQALNTMLDSLKMRRVQLEEYSKILKRKVQERTNDLVSSEEKYRTLVENVPLIVYRVLPDGTTEFVNPYLSESLGYSVEEAVSDKRFWLGRISSPGSKAYKTIYNACFLQGKECRVERSLRDKNGRILTFIEHAIPAKDEHGKVKWIDGIMMDITELKRLQERALRTEEIRILGEMSALVAHEIRNPLATAGGFARRLRDSFEKEDPHYKLAQIIVKEVVRLENFLKILISSIQPFDLVLKEMDINRLLNTWSIDHEDVLKTKGIELVKELNPEIPVILADEERINQALESLLNHAVASVPPGEPIHISTDKVGDRIIVSMKHQVHNFSEDDLEKFFFPHMEEDSKGETLMDLPLSRIIIHRHGGTIDINLDKDNILAIRIELPIRSAMDSN
jgi:PAS domain S-box-containing protein